MYMHLGLTGAYLTWTVLFILLGGGVLGSLVIGRWRLPKFYLLFGLAFFAYAFGWCAAYFAFGDGAGEWIGSIVGSVLMAFIFAMSFRAVKSVVTLSMVLFVANSAGYFLGSVLNNSFGGKVGMLSWGAAYGLFLGAGLGVVLHLGQTRSALRD
jgi:hypothetical protein